MALSDPVARAVELESRRRVRQHAPRPVIFTCWSCTHAIRRGENYLGVPRFWCDKHERTASAKCASFEYEPGTDEGERVA